MEKAVGRRAPRGRRLNPSCTCRGAAGGAGPVYIAHGTTGGAKEGRALGAPHEGWKEKVAAFAATPPLPSRAVQHRSAHPRPAEI